MAYHASKQAHNDAGTCLKFRLKILEMITYAKPAKVLARLDERGIYKFSKFSHENLNDCPLGNGAPDAAHQHPTNHTRPRKDDLLKCGKNANLCAID